MISLQRFKVKAGDDLSSAHFNAFIAAVERGFLTGGKGIRISRVGNRVAISVKQKRRILRYPLKIKTTRGAAQLKLEFARGMIAGRVPTIDQKPITKTGTQLAVGKDAIKDGVGYVFARVTLDPSWNVTKAELVALAKPPASAPWIAYKLIAFILDDGNGNPDHVEPMVFFNVGLGISDQRRTGRFKPWWFVG